MTQQTHIRRVALSLAADGLPVLPLRGKVPFGNCRACAGNACGGRPDMKNPGPCQCAGVCHAWAAATTNPHVINSPAWGPAWRAAAVVAYHPGGAGLTVVDLDNAAAVAWAREKAPREAHPVPVTAGPWPGVPVRGRGAAARAEACWLPIKDGLTRHGLRHGHRTLLEELGVPKVLIDERMGHEDGSVSALCTHITDSMRAAMVDGLTDVWPRSLDDRLALAPRSAVPTLDALLQERAASAGAPLKITPS
jgi:hypothetical protein